MPALVLENLAALPAVARGLRMLLVRLARAIDALVSGDRCTTLHFSGLYPLRGRRLHKPLLLYFWPAVVNDCGPHAREGVKRVNLLNRGASCARECHRRAMAHRE